MPEPRLTRRARNDLEALPETVREAVLETLTLIGAEPERAGKRLVGRLEGLWSARVGNYRVLYTVQGGRVIVRAIRHRAVAYRRRRGVMPGALGPCRYPGLVELERARDFIREHHRGVLATRRSGDRIQHSPVLVNVDGEGRAIISSRETAHKVKNLRRDRWAQVVVFTNKFFGDWVYAEGEAEILSLPEAMDPLIDYYKRFPDENPDWDDYRARMEREKRVLIRIELLDAGPDSRG